MSIISLDQSKYAYAAMNVRVEKVAEGYKASIPTHPTIQPLVKGDEVEAIAAMNNRISAFLASNFEVTDG